VISFRQHVVTIVAIFLALALGLLAGSAFIQPRLVDDLHARVDDQLTQIHDLQGQLAEQRDRLAAESAFNDSALSHLTTGQLAGEPVVVIAQDGVEDAVVASSRQALADAGATVVAMSARDTLAPQDPDAQQALAQALGLPGASPEDLPGLAAEAIADRLATDERRSAAGQVDLLHELLANGYLAPLGSGVSDATLETIGGANQIVVVLAGGQSTEPAMAPDAFAMPLVERLGELGTPVAAGESVGTVEPFVTALRSQGVDGVVTVDDLDDSRGGAALVLGLRRRLDTGDGGDYGVKAGAVPLPPRT
jgi:Copper transport outer membrane protein, MctB